MSGELIKASALDNQALVIYGKIQDTIAWCKEMGQAFHVTFGLTSPHHGTVMALTCISEGISPTDFHKRYHGDGSMRASSIQAMFLDRGGKIVWGNIGDDGKKAEATFSHPRNQPEPLTIAYTIEDARRQVGPKFDKDGSNWKTNPGAMLRAALVRKAVKIIDPGIIGGYDDFSEFEQQQPLATVTSSKPTESELQARRAELLAGSQNEQIIDAVIEQPAATATTATIDEAPFDSGPQLSTTAQRAELYALMQKLGQKSTPPQSFTAEEVGEQIVKAGKGAFTSCDQAPKDLLDRMIALVRGRIS